MSEKSSGKNKADWIVEGYAEMQKQEREQTNLRLLQQAYNEGLQAGGEAEAKRRMDALYRELNGEADKPAKP